MHALSLIFGLTLTQTVEKAISLACALLCLLFAFLVLAICAALFSLKGISKSLRQKTPLPPHPEDFKNLFKPLGRFPSEENSV